jgi:hypothetical protein
VNDKNHFLSATSLIPDLLNAVLFALILLYHVILILDWYVNK